MGLKAIVDSLDEVPESIRDLYQETEDGRFALSVEGMVPEDNIETHERTKGLRSALEKEREARKEFEKLSKELKNKVGKVSEEDLQELEELRGLRRKAEEERRRREGEFDKWKDEINKEHKAELESRENLIKSLQDQIRQGRIGNEISEACAEFGAVNPKVMGAFVKGFVEAGFDDEGKLSVAVKDPEDGNRMFDGEGKPLSIHGFVKKLSESKDYADLFASRQKSGGGTPPGDRDGRRGSNNSGERPHGNEPDLESMSASEQRRYKIRKRIDEFRKNSDGSQDQE